MIEWWDNDEGKEKKIKTVLCTLCASLSCPRKLMDKLSGFYPDHESSNLSEGTICYTQKMKINNIGKLVIFIGVAEAEGVALKLKICYTISVVH